MGRGFIIAIDFDGTIVQDEWPRIGRLRKNVRKVINQLHDVFGVNTVLWTCRGGKQLQQTKQFLKRNDIHIDAINQNVKYVKQTFGNVLSCKIYADYYIDDKALGGIIDWDQIFQIVVQQLNRKGMIE